MAASPRRVELSGTDTPLDFSFLNITTVTEIPNEEPREQGKKKVEKVLVEVPVHGEDCTETEEKYRYKARCLRINNNLLQDLNGLLNILDDILVDPLSLTWVDLSFNELTKIDPCLCDIPTLQILYFHGNHIADITEIDKVAGMPHLYKLTVHGNPCDTTKGYRQYVLSKVPHLRSLDFSAVTKADRANASTFKMPRPQKKKKESED